jgi:type III secretion protein Y
MDQPWLDPTPLAVEPPPLAFDDSNRRALHALGYLYLRHGYPRRALAVLTLLDRQCPGDPAVLRTLAYAWMAVGDGEHAVWIIRRLKETTSVVEAPLLLLESRALFQAGEVDEARRRFRAFVALRRAAATQAPPADTPTH